MHHTHLEIKQLLSNKSLKFIRLGTIGLHNFLSTGQHFSSCQLLITIINYWKGLYHHSTKTHPTTEILNSFSVFQSTRLIHTTFHHLLSFGE